MEMYIFGEIKEFPKGLKKSDIYEILSKAHDIKEKLKEITTDDILTIFHKLSKLWIDPEYKYTKEALTKLPDLIKFDKSMIYEGIKTMCSMLDRYNMETRIICDLGKREYLDDWTYHKRFKGYVKAMPRGVVAHVSAGNVFVGGVDSLIQGIMTKNVNIMKMSTVDPLFPILFARSLKENDHTGILHRAMALLHWKGGTEEIENPIKSECNAIVVYGGANTVKSYRRNLGLHTKLIEYGPKYSFVIVEEKKLKEVGFGEAAKLIARDGLMWEQSACSSPHLVYVEGEENAKKLAKEISKAFDKWYEILPQGKLYDDELVEITKVRELAKVEKALGKSDIFIGKNGFNTVVYQKKKEFQISCLNRTLFVKGVEKIEDVIEIIKPMGEYIQTVAILAEDDRAKDLASNLSFIGADRMVEIGRMAVRKHGTPHDGTKGLSELIKWVSLSRNKLEADWEVGPLWKKYDPEKDYFDFLDDKTRDELTLKRLINIFDHARKHSPLLSKRYKGMEVRSFEDFRKVPLLTGKDMKKYLPPMGDGLLTSDVKSGYIFSSGGTTGTPKVVYRTLEEQHFNAVRLGKGLLLSVFEEGDVVANLLFAGNMWASFVSYNQALEHTGCRILPIGGNLPMETIINYLITFKANCIITIPSVLLSIGEYVEKNKIDLKIEKVSTGGEHLFKEAKEYLKRVLGIKKFASTGYTTNDTGAIGYQCKYCEGGIHHLHEDLHYMEIVDEDGNPCKPGEIGRIIVTNLQRKLMPTIRYEVGDLGRWIERKCECGRKTRLFELLGRSDDVLIIGGGNIHPEVIAESISEIGKLSNHFQMIAEIYNKKDRLKVRVEAKEREIQNKKDIEEKLKELIYNKSKELRTMFKEGLIEDIYVEIVPPNTLERNPRTGKIRLVIDERS